MSSNQKGNQTLDVKYDQDVINFSLSSVWFD
jgi:hypothetical protein